MNCNEWNQEAHLRLFYSVTDQEKVRKCCVSWVLGAIYILHISLHIS